MREPGDSLTLADYRRRTDEIYADVRAQNASVYAWEKWKEERDLLFLTHKQTPIDPGVEFTGLSYFPYNPRLAFEAEVEAVEASTVAIGHSGEGATAMRSFGQVHLQIEGREVSLTLYWLEAYGGGIFLPFRDSTSGADTYGGGRYLIDTVKGADLGGRSGMIRLDFNFSYHPSCVHSIRWSCPLAPPANHLKVPVTAGERLLHRA